MEKFQNKYCIPSARANWHDYKGGVYFVTICTKNREHYLGEITHCCRDVAHICTDVARNVSTEPQMHLSPIGQYAYDQFINVKTHYPYAKIPLFVIMPDHIHAIVTIDGENEIGGNGAHTQCRDVARRCGDVARNVSTFFANPFFQQSLEHITSKYNHNRIVFQKSKQTIEYLHFIIPLQCKNKRKVNDEDTIQQKIQRKSRT